MDNKDLPAFPDPLRSAPISEMNQSPLFEPAGLTKREYFAAMAMQGYMANYYAPYQNSKEVATYAVLCADALLLELRPNQPNNNDEPLDDTPFDF